MQNPMVGNWRVLVHGVQPYSIHGDLYYEMQVSRFEDEPGKLLMLRMPQHVLKSQPRAGDKLSVGFLMGQVVQAKTLG
jgi:hypothetical protein